MSNPFATGTGANGGSGPPDDVFEFDAGCQEGPHLGVIRNVTKDISSAGNPMWIWDIQPVMDQNKKILTSAGCMAVYTALTQAAAWKVDEMMAAIGIPANEDGKYRFSKKDVIGKIVRIDVEQQEYEGRTRFGIGNVGPSGMSEEELKGIMGQIPESVVDPEPAF